MEHFDRFYGNHNWKKKIFDKTKRPRRSVDPFVRETARVRSVLDECGGFGEACVDAGFGLIGGFAIVVHPELELFDEFPVGEHEICWH